MSKQHDPKIDLEPAPAASLASMERLAKTQAVATFENKLATDGIPGSMAKAIARAVVDPADARRRLERLTQLRVPGGIVYALETTVWATAAVAYAVNNRPASERHFPAGTKIGSSEAARYRPLRPPTDPGDGTARLEIAAQENKHLIWSLDRSAKYLLENNNWTESIGAQGVMQHVTLACVDIRFANGDPAVTMLGSADGSSRVTSAHEVLGLTPHDVVYRYPSDERAHRQFIATLLANLDRPVADVAVDDVIKLRALQIPARIFVKFEPDPVTPVSFSKAVESFVHLVHVEPAKPWDQAASLDAKADSVLNELLAQGQITPKQKTYFEGMLSPEEARKIRMPEHLDERALEIAAKLSSEKNGVHRAVRAGILLLSKRGGRISKQQKAEIAVELALRGVRSNLTKSEAKGARETLLAAYLHDDIWAKGLKSDGRPPDELRDAALAELEAGGPGDACRLIAGLGAYWLGVQRVLREARFFETDESLRDSRQPDRVLTGLMSSAWGIHTLHRAIVDGRDQVEIVQVDETGARQKGPSGKILPATHDWLRDKVAPQQQLGGAVGAANAAGSNGGPTLPDRLLLDRLGGLRQAVDLLEDKHAQIRDVTDASGTVLVDEDGLALDTMTDLRERLEELRTAFAIYGRTWKTKNAIEEQDEAIEGVEP